MKDSIVSLLLVLFSIFTTSYSSILLPVSQCLSDCFKCDSADISQCNNKLEGNCLKGFTQQNLSNCVVDLKNYKVILFQENNTQVNAHSLVNYKCSLPKLSDKSTSTLITVQGSGKSELTRNFSLIMEPQSNITTIQVYFDIFHDELQVFNDYISISLLVNGEVVKSDQFSLIFRKEQTFPLNCGQYKLKVSKFSYEYSSKLPIQNIGMVFQGHMINGHWSIYDVKVVYQCLNCSSKIGSIEPKIQPKPLPNSQLESLPNPQLVSQPITPSDSQTKPEKDPNDNNVQEKKPSSSNEGTTFVQKHNIKHQCKLSILPRNDLAKLQTNLLSIQIICPTLESINQVRIGIDKLNPYQQQIYNLKHLDNKTLVDIVIPSSFTAGVMDVYSVKESENATSKKLELSYLTNLPQSSSESITMDSELFKQFPVNRYDAITQPQGGSLVFFKYLFSITVWLCILGIIMSVLLNKAVIWEELIIANQMLFLLVYIFTQYLPLTMREAYDGLARIESLNYFLSPAKEIIEQIWIGRVIQDSPLRYTYYKPDINFTRTFHPTIILNLVFLVWLGLLILINLFLKAQENSSITRRRLSKFANQTANSKMRFLDQIWRYQFLMTLWACLLQFYNFKYPESSASSGAVNAILCMFSFFGTIAWPVIFFFYSRKQLQQAQPGYGIPPIYNDVLFLKNSGIEESFSKGNQMKLTQTLYPILRSCKLVLFAISCSFLGQIPLLALFIISTIMVVQIIYIFLHRIFTDRIYRLTRLIENCVFVIVCVLMMIAYGISNHADQTGYSTLGYIILSMGVLIILNGLFRAGYLISFKLQIFKRQNNQYPSSEKESKFVKAPTTQRETL